jgi:hypothetical protein
VDIYNLDLSNEEFRKIAAQAAYNAGIAGLEPMVFRGLQNSQRIEKLLVRVAELEAKLAKLEAATPPHLAKVERRNT